jgi:hypothetical protein
VALREKEERWQADAVDAVDAHCFGRAGGTGLVIRARLVVALLQSTLWAEEAIVVVVVLVGATASEKSDGKRHSGSWGTRTSLLSTSKRGGMVQAAGAKAVAAAAGSRPP